MSDANQKIDLGASKHSVGGPMSKAHVVKLAKEGFGHGSTNYDKNRPSYTKEVVDFAVKEITTDTPPSRPTVKYNVLELGAGTGKFTEDLAPRLPETTKYLATEPSSDFFQLLQSKQLPVETAMAAANYIPLENNSVENIVCAQCFHWFSNDESLREMHRVLVPGGKLILVWNANKFDEGWPTEVSKQRLEVMERVGASIDLFFPTMNWRNSIDASPLFSLCQHRSLPGIEFRCNIDKVIDHTRTIAAYNTLPGEEREEYLDNLKQAILAWPEVDPEVMVIPYTSEVYLYICQENE